MNNLQSIIDKGGPWERAEIIGDCLLLQGDCMEIMPFVGKVDAVVDCCDAVVYTDKHGKTANWEPETPSASGVNMGKPQSRNSGDVCRGADVTGATGGSFLCQSTGRSEGFEADGDQTKAKEQGGRTERTIHRRDAKHDLQEDGGKDALQQMRGNGSTRCASCGRKPHEQRGRKFGSVVQPLPQQPPQTGVVEFEEGWAIITDPPYGIGADRNLRANKKQGKAAAPSKDYGAKTWDTNAPDLGWVGDCGVPAIVWGGNYFRLPPGPGWLFWDKENGSNGYADGELAWSNLPQALRRFKWRWAGMLQQDMSNKEERVHPTQKPVALMEWCINHLPKDTKTILDPFMGSGTTLVACAKMGRMGIGIEQDPDYFEIACDRVRKAYDQPDMFVKKPMSIAEIQEGFEL